MSYDVTKDRQFFLGGSDISTIMGINPFKTRWELLQEKAGLITNDFEGNEYTEFGNVIEPKIRDYINESELYKKPFREDQIIVDDMRYHDDGFNGEAVLEIKSTSMIKDKLEDYKTYLVQLVFGMTLRGVEKGLLAVYERPKDFDTVLDTSRLQTYPILIDNFKELQKEIEGALNDFRRDLARLKENPFLTEEELQPTELIVLSDKIVALENKLLEFKEVEKEQKDLKEQLKSAMEKHNIKKWTTNQGTQITLVADGKDEEIEKIDYKTLEKQNADLVKKYTTTEIKKGRKGYVKITL